MRPSSTRSWRLPSRPPPARKSARPTASLVEGDHERTLCHAAALVLRRSLRVVDDEYLSGERDTEALARRPRGQLAREALARIDYAELVTPDTFAHPGRLAVLAVRIGPTRLIDNHRLGDPF